MGGKSTIIIVLIQNATHFSEVEVYDVKIWNMMCKYEDKCT